MYPYYNFNYEIEKRALEERAQREENYFTSCY